MNTILSGLYLLGMKSTASKGESIWTLQFSRSEMNCALGRSLIRMLLGWRNLVRILVHMYTDISPSVIPLQLCSMNYTFCRKKLTASSCRDDLVRPMMIKQKKHWFLISMTHWFLMKKHCIISKQEQDFVDYPWINAIWIRRCCPLNAEFFLIHAERLRACCFRKMWSMFRFQAFLQN